MLEETEFTLEESFFRSGVLLGTRDAALRINDTKIKTDGDGEEEKKKKKKALRHGD